MSSTQAEPGGSTNPKSEKISPSRLDSSLPKFQRDAGRLSDRLRARRYLSSSYRFISSAAFVPPNPKEFDSAYLTSARRAELGT